MTVTTYNLAPCPLWTLRTASGAILSAGTLETFRALAPSEHKPVYSDAAGENPYPNPLQFTDAGDKGPIYWASDENYYIIIRDDAGNVKFTATNFNAPIGSGSDAPITVIEDFVNHVRNGQFYFPATIPTPLPATPIRIADGDWYFSKSNTNATDTLTIEPFILGQTDVEKNPINFAHYVCSAVGGGAETYKDIYQRLGDVISFGGTPITFQVRAISPTSSPIQFIARQYFGTGGSPSTTVDTVLLTFNCTPAWSLGEITFNIPSVGGKVLGSNGDDGFYIIVRMPLNAISDVSITNVQLQEGSQVQVYQFQTETEVIYETRGSQLPRPANDGSDRGKAIIVGSNGFSQTFGIPGVTGQIIIFSGLLPEDTGMLQGWLLADKRALSRTTYAALNQFYAALGYPWGNGDGSTTFNIADMSGRALVGAGSGSGLTVRTVGQEFGEETHTMTTNELALHQHDQAIDGLNVSGGPYIWRQGTPGSGTGATLLSSTFASTTVGGVAVVTENVGLSTPFNVTQPSAVFAVYVKY